MQNIVRTSKNSQTLVEPFFNQEKVEKKTTRKQDQENSFSSVEKKSFIFFFMRWIFFIHIKNEGTDSEVSHNDIFLSIWPYKYVCLIP
jgi:hypothetical protein